MLDPRLTHGDVGSFSRGRCRLGYVSEHVKRYCQFTLRCIGVAYTIDSAYESEARDYLGLPNSLIIWNRILMWRTDYREKVRQFEPFTFRVSSIDCVGRLYHGKGRCVRYRSFRWQRESHPARCGCLFPLNSLKPLRNDWHRHTWVSRRFGDIQARNIYAVLRGA